MCPEAHPVSNGMTENFEKKIGIIFKNKDLLRQAFVHRSYINENKDKKLESNERLEFLGDAVLELVSTEYLFNHYPEKQEGELTALRASLVNTASLSGTAGEIGMNEHILLSKGEAKDSGRARQVILADAFEALVGAIYLDKGQAGAEKFLEKVLMCKAEEIIRENKWQDPKSKLQEKIQEEAGVTPSYKTLKESGPDHNKTFIVGLYAGEKLLAEGKGHSKQEAEEDAAKKALKKGKL